MTRVSIESAMARAYCSSNPAFGRIAKRQAVTCRLLLRLRGVVAVDAQHGAHLLVVLEGELRALACDGVRLQVGGAVGDAPLVQVLDLRLAQPQRLLAICCGLVSELIRCMRALLRL